MWFVAASRTSSRKNVVMSANHLITRLVIAPLSLMDSIRPLRTLDSLLSLSRFVLFLFPSTIIQHIKLHNFDASYTAQDLHNVSFAPFADISTIKRDTANTSASRILSHAIQTKILDPKLLPLLLRNARAALFPNNAPAPPRIIPSPAEQLAIRQRCAQIILSLIPTKVQGIYFGGGEERRTKEVEDILDVFDDSYCNKHLLYSIVELVIVRLIPEMGEKGIEELLEERLN